METVRDFIFLGSKITADGDCGNEIKRHLLLGRNAMTNIDIKKQRWYFANKGPSSQSFGFSSGHTWMRELDYKENWALKNWCFWTVVWEKTLESPLDSKQIQPVHPKRNQSWIFIGRTDVEAETPILWPPDAKTLLKRLWCQGRLKVGAEGDNRRWDSWMALLTQWTWAWVSSRSWWWTGKPGVLQSMGLQKVGHDWATKLNWLNYWKEGILLLQVDHKSFGICCTFHLKTKEELSTRNKFKRTVGNKRKVVHWLCSLSFAYSTWQLHSTDKERQTVSSKKGVGWQIRRPPMVLLRDLYMWETIMMKMLKAM